MKNIYELLALLEDRRQIKKFSALQQEFIHSILEGAATRPGLYELIQARQKDGLLDLKKNIQSQISQSDPGIQDLAFVNLLKNIAKCIQEILEKEASLTYCAENLDYFKKEYQEPYGAIYASLESEFNGTLMLPINQDFDPRIGESSGVCFGYVAEWACQLFVQQKFCGLAVDAAPPFKALTALKSWSHYPDINHLAVVNADIAFYQNNQTELFDLLNKLSKHQLKDKKRISFKRHEYYLLDSTERIAAELIKKVHKNVGTVYILALCNENIGHCVGFCKLNNHYHFLDANLGWFRFERAEDFQRWLPFYFNLMEYNQKYAEYAFNEYFLTSRPLFFESHLDDEDFGCFIKDLLLSPFLFVFELLRSGFQYLKNLFKKQEPVQMQETPAQPKPLESVLPKRLDYLDLAQSNPPVNKAPSSVAKIAALLDVSPEALVEVQKRAELNEDFKNVKLKKEPVSVESNVPPEPRRARRNSV